MCYCQYSGIEHVVRRTGTGLTEDVLKRVKTFAKNLLRSSDIGVGMVLRVSKAGGSEATLILLRDDTPATPYSKVVLLPCDSTIAAVDLWAFECAAPGLILRGSTFRP